MKYLIILAMMIPAGIYGQTTKTSASTQNAPNFSIGSEVTKVVTLLKYDTIHCIMLVSDTSAYKTWEVVKAPDLGYIEKATLVYRTIIPVFSIRGYEVSHEERQEKVYYSGMLNEQQGRAHDAYLDDKKQPLKLFVWMSKKIK